MREIILLALLTIFFVVLFIVLNEKQNNSDSKNGFDNDYALGMRKNIKITNKSEMVSYKLLYNYQEREVPPQDSILLYVAEGTEISVLKENPIFNVGAPISYNFEGKEINTLKGNSIPLATTSASISSKTLITRRDMVKCFDMYIIDGEILRKDEIISPFSFKIIGDWYTCVGNRIRNGVVTPRKESIGLALMTSPKLRISSKNNKTKSVVIPIKNDMSDYTFHPTLFDKYAYVGETFIVDVLNDSRVWRLGEGQIQDKYERVLIVSPGKVLFSSS